MMKRLIIPTLLSFALAGAASASTYNIDPRHAQVLFTYDHFGYSHQVGRLNQVTGTIEFDPAKPTNSSIELQLPMSSLSTGVPKLDTHMSSSAMFDVEQFPTASFKSSKVAEIDKAHLKVTGDLTIHGVTKPVLLDVTINNPEIDPMQKVAAIGFDASTTIKRSDFGIDFMLPKVADEVRLNISMEAREPQKEDPGAKKPG
jgi:polyisoprenoid-binding protein YceI